MKKVFITLVISFVILIIFPFPVHGEEVDEQKKGVLSGTIDQLVSMTEKFVDSVKENVSKTAPSKEAEEIPPILKPITDVVHDVEENTSPAIEQVITDVTEITKSTVPKLVNVVDETIDILPEVPIVTPVLTKVSKSTKKVTIGIQKTVKTGDETVKQVIEFAGSVVESKSENILSEETSTTDSSIAPKLAEQIINFTPPVPVSKEEISISEIEKTAEIPIDQPVLKTNSEAEEGNAGQEADKFQIEEEYDFAVIETNRNMKNKKHVHIPVLPINPMEQNQKIVISNTPMITNNTNVTSSSVSLIIGGDIHMGYLPSYVLLKELGRKKWYHKNSYAIIQWLHTPLRKPPEKTPFLYVI
ncbi:hypothetical protein PB01_02580 [Psychrobacillus glaciei]|uniref:Uncharacterized protein n=1 Tax=Psychrobacillus glaciei TaxID=2283160 RepID=A0A5J6SNJ8_9BACI|nr:hypothetical protein [Psychrobacillus glaciei]QFF97787.1 hypothetical protein PB01_02580 [Psychrobacillus glaciei]